jgi:hypothetical protein
MVLGSEIRDPRSGIRDPGSEIRDPRSGIRKKPIPDPGSRGQKGTGSGSATLQILRCIVLHWTAARL